MAFQYSAHTVTKYNGSIVDNFVREKTKHKTKMRTKPLKEIKKNGNYFFFLKSISLYVWQV